MMTHTILNKDQKEALIKASNLVGLSLSAFLRQAAIEKINKMGIQINTSKGVNLDNSSSNTTINGVDDNEIK